MQIFNLDYNRKMRIFLLCLLLLSCSQFQGKRVIQSSDVVELLEYNSLQFKARIDTGATSSTIHAEEITILDSTDIKRVQFFLRDDKNLKHGPFQAKLLDLVKVKSSNSSVSRRPVVELKILIHGYQQNARFTLYDRSKMSYRVLVGRDLLHAGNFLVQP
jgi:hypothetical protein